MLPRLHRCSGESGAGNTCHSVATRSRIVQAVTRINARAFNRKSYSLGNVPRGDNSALVRLAELLRYTEDGERTRKILNSA